MRERSSCPSSLGLINKPLEDYSEWEGNGKELLLLPYNELRQRLLLLSVSSHLSLTSRASRNRPGAFEDDFLQMEKERKRRERSISPCCCCCIFLLDIFVRKIFLWRDCIQQLETDVVRFLIQVSLLSCSLSSLKASLESLRRLWWCLTTRCWMGGWMGRWVGFVYTRSAH